MSSVEDRLAAAITARVGARDIWLCGSRAIGTASDESDYDVLVALPLRRIAFDLPRLARLSRALSAEVGVPVAVNPLPKIGFRSRRPNLFTWKLLQEARPLAGAATPRAVPPIVITPRLRFSYLASALWYLVDDTIDNSRPGRGEQKARLHLAQLQLLDRGVYASTLDEALAAVDDPLLRVRSWEATRGLVVKELEPLLRDGELGGALRVNVRYVLLSALRGHIRVAPALRRTPVDVALVRKLVLLVSAGDSAADASWKLAVSAVRSEWPSAHPLLAQ